MTRLRALGQATGLGRPVVVVLGIAAIALFVLAAMAGMASRPGGNEASAIGDPAPGDAVLAQVASNAPARHLTLMQIASDGPAPPPPTPTPTPVPPPPSSPAGLTIWGGGDSLSVYMNSQLYGLAYDNGMTPVYTCTNGATKDQSCVTSSSLRNRGWYDWPTALADMAALDPDVIVFMIGGNDAYSMNGYEPGTDGWREAYGELVGSAMDQVRGDGRYVIWVGQPNARYAGYPDFDARMAAVNSVFVEQAASRPDVAFVDTYALFGGADFDAYAHLRASDGLHFTSAGGRYLAEEVLRTLIQMMDARRDASFTD